MCTWQLWVVKKVPYCEPSGLSSAPWLGIFANTNKTWYFCFIMKVGSDLGNPISSTLKYFIIFLSVYVMGIWAAYISHGTGWRSEDQPMDIGSLLLPHGSQGGNIPGPGTAQCALDPAPAVSTLGVLSCEENRFFWRFCADFSVTCSQKAPPKPTYDSNTLTTKGSCGQSASLQGRRPLTPHPMAGWVGHTLAERLNMGWLSFIPIPFCV